MVFWLVKKVVAFLFSKNNAVLTDVCYFCVDLEEDFLI